VLYDLKLFEQLNEEYRERPIIAPSRVANRRRLLGAQAVHTREESVRYAADRQLKPMLKHVDPSGRNVLEVGCGAGYMTAALVEHANAAAAVGIDVKTYPSWAENADPRVRLMAADLSVDRVVPSESVDLVVSQVTFEHVARPLQMLAAIHDALTVGGTAWLYMNLHTARNASHCYMEVFFPWPHLLFGDDVVQAFYEKHHGWPRKRFSWVNRMTVAHYLGACRELGFQIEEIRRTVSPIDVPFYLRFEDELGRYQALDLETDFLLLVLTKGTGDPERTATALASVNYYESQRALDAAIGEVRLAQQAVR
jgi:SAM-dependent methyltransferase